MRLTIFIFSFCLLSSANQCTFLLETFLSPRGTESFSVSSKGQLTSWHDEYRMHRGGRSFQFQRLDEWLPSSIHGPQRFVSLLPGRYGDKFGVAGDSTGGLFLATPNQRSVPIYLGNDRPLHSLGILRPSVYEHLDLMGYPFLRERSPELTDKDVVHQLWTNMEEDTTVLYLSSGRGLLRLTLKMLGQDALSSEERQALDGGQVLRLSEGGLLVGETPDLKKRNVEVAPIIDLEKAGSRYLVSGGRMDSVLEISPLEKVWEAPKLDLTSIDFIRPVNRDVLVLASELGEVVVLGPKGKTLHRLNLDRPGWLSDLSAHHVGGDLKIWAIGKHDGQIYHWDSHFLAPQLRPHQDQLPLGVRAAAIASFGERFPVGFFPASEKLGFYSNYVPSSKFHYLERIICLGTDGELYGYVDDRYWRTQPAGWVSHPFSQGAPLGQEPLSENDS